MTLPRTPLDANIQPITNTFEPSGTTQKINSAGSSAQSSAFSTDTVVRIISDAVCHYKIGTNPTATTNDVYLPADSAEQIRIYAGNKIAVIGTVNLYVTEYV